MLKVSAQEKETAPIKEGARVSGLSYKRRQFCCGDITWRTQPAHWSRSDLSQIIINKPHSKIDVRHLLTHSHKTHWSLYGIEQMAYPEPALAQQPCAPREGGGIIYACAPLKTLYPSSVTTLTWLQLPLKKTPDDALPEVEPKWPISPTAGPVLNADIWNLVSCDALWDMGSFLKLFRSLKLPSNTLNYKNTILLALKLDYFPLVWGLLSQPSCSHTFD